MRNFDVRKLQLKEMELILEVDRICKKHNINYYLSWGSALGAIRHKGFIPWDDDIDISMFWYDYLRFKEICKEELDGKYFYQSIDTENNFWLTWDKVRINNTTSMDREFSHIDCNWGICMDIFPIVAIPKSSMSQSIQKINVRIYKFLCNKNFIINIKDNGLKSKIKRLIYNLIPNNILDMLKEKCLKNITKYDLDDNNICGEILSMPYDKALIDKSIYGNPIEVEFENYKFPVPEKYDEYLTSCYGDYMKLPPEHERIGHGNIIVDLENSYKKYLNLK